MKIHFLGIGGIGVSALAQYYLSKGHEVSGEDVSSSEITDYLQKQGIEIFIGKGSESELQITNYKLPDLVIHTPAIKPENPALKKFIDKGVKTLTYPQALGELTKEYFTIAISGSHGKSTTTSMVALILIEAGLDPTVIVGTKLKEFGGTNFRMGKPDKSPKGHFDGSAIMPAGRALGGYLVIEACEHEESFLSYWPKMAVITNIEAEHLDYYKNLKNVIKGFAKFVSHLPKDGILVINAKDKNSAVIARKLSLSKLTKQSNRLRLLRFARNDESDQRKIKRILKVPGKHNVANALAALSVARALGIKDEVSYLALSKFRGTWRRFEEKQAQISNFKFQVISDYGHHPTEVAATMAAAHEKYPKKTIWLVFQPHQYQRTFYLLKDFIKIFKSAKINNIIITDIYDVAGRENEEIKKKIDAQKLVKKIGRKNVIYVPQADCENYVKQNIKSGNILLIIGAGDIYRLFDRF